MGRWKGVGIVVVVVSAYGTCELFETLLDVGANGRARPSVRLAGGIRSNAASCKAGRQKGLLERHKERWCLSNTKPVRQ